MARNVHSGRNKQKDTKVISIDREYLKRRDAFVAEKSFDSFLSLLEQAITHPGKAEEVSTLWQSHYKDIPWSPSATDRWAGFLSHYLVVPEETENAEAEKTQRKAGTDSGLNDTASHSPAYDIFAKVFSDLANSEEEQRRALRRSDKYGPFIEAFHFDEALTEVFGEWNPAITVASYLNACFPKQPWCSPDDMVFEPKGEFRVREWRDIYISLLVWTSGLHANNDPALKEQIREHIKDGVGGYAAIGFTTLAVNSRNGDLFSEHHLREYLPQFPQALLVSIIRTYLNYGDTPSRPTGLLRLLRLGIGESAEAAEARDIVGPYVPWSFVVPLINKFSELIYAGDASYGDGRSGEIVRAIHNQIKADFESHLRKISCGISPLPITDLAQFAGWLSWETFLSGPLHYRCTMLDGSECLWEGDLEFSQGKMMALFEGALAEGHSEFATALLAFFLFARVAASKGVIGDWKAFGPLIDTALRLPGADRVRTAIAFASEISVQYGESLQALNLRVRIEDGDLAKAPEGAVQSILSDNKSRDHAKNRLIQELGQDRWLRLDHRAKQFFTDAEVHWLRNADELGRGTFSDWGQIATYYGRAIEAHLLAKFDPIWNSPEMAEYRPAIASKRERPTSGPVIHTLKAFSELPSSLQRLIESKGIGLHRDRELISQLLGILETRNKGAHPGDVTERDALDLRTRLFKKRILARLIDCFA